jgi:hypothetical protein
MARSPNQAQRVPTRDQVLLFNSKVKLLGEGKLRSGKDRTPSSTHRPMERSQSKTMTVTSSKLTVSV